MIKSVKKRFNWLTKVFFDKRTGFYYYLRYGYKIFIRQPRHFLPEKDNRWICEHIFFRHYLPTNGEQVVDLGIGYGEEAVFLKSHSPEVKYLGVEAQPVIYECVSNTFDGLGGNFNTSPFCITNESNVKFVSRYSYAHVGSVPEGYIEIPTLSWSAFLRRYHIHQIDLLKMNIEGAEKQLMESIEDFSLIKRCIVSCHDFRAKEGAGDFFRTKKDVIHTLEENGFKIETFDYGLGWSDDWIFASKDK